MQAVSQSLLTLHSVRTAIKKICQPARLGAAPQTILFKSKIPIQSNMKVYELLDTSNPVFCSYIVWTSILAIKVMLMSTLTSLQRFRNQVIYRLL